MDKLVIVKSGGSLPIRGGINGPITSPTFLNVKEIVTLLNKFKEVYEVNPYTGEQIRLTRIKQYLFLRKKKNFLRRRMILFKQPMMCLKQQLKKLSLLYLL